MKNKRREIFLFKKIFHIVTILFIILCHSISINAENSIGKSQKNYNMTDVTVQTLIDHLAQDFQYSFFIVDEAIANIIVSINTKKTTIEEILNEAFSGKGISFTITNKTITISSSKNTLLPTNMYKKEQTLLIQGKIIDSNDMPIIGANIIEKNSKSNGTITDSEGHFSLKVSPNAVLLISFIGYIPQEIPVSNKNSFTIVLKEDTKLLDEVVVVGYGIQRKINLTGSISAVSTKEISKRQVSNTSEALQGLIPGLSVIQRGGGPGDAAGLRVRGYTTLGNVTPLILVDGIEMGIDNIDPSIIESISVLKDAASASIYGNRAAAGVILITTKRAEKEQVNISYNGFIGQQKVVSYPKNVGAIDHMELLSEAQRNVGITPTFTEEHIQNYKANLGKDYDRYPDTDWYKEVLSNSGLMQSHTLSVSGASKRVSIMGAVGFLEQKGVIPNVKKERYFIRFNSDIHLSSKLKAKLDGHISQTNYQQPTRSPQDVFHWTMRIPANKPAVLSNGKWGEGWNGDNPVAFSKEGGISKNQNPSVTLNMGIEYNPVDWATLKFSYAPNYWKTYNTTQTLPIQSFYPDGEPAYTNPQQNNLWNSYSQNRIHQFNATLDFQKKINEHFISSIIGFQQEDYRNDGFGASRKDFVFTDFPVLSGGSTEEQQAHGWASDWAMRSFFGRINYVYKNKYLFEANARYDGSSRFSKGHKWGFFPSLSAGWRISEEPFWNINQIENLKIRASYGKLGNQLIGNYPFASVIALWPKYIFNDKPVNGAAVTTLPNSEISWETTSVANIGVDISFLKHFSLTADVYNKKTTGILLKLDVPLVIGMDAPVQNAGVVSNKGWEVALKYENNDHPFKYSIGFNIGDVINKIDNLKGLKSDGLLVNNEGYAMNSLLLFKAIGYITEKDYDAEGKYLHAQQFGNFGPGDIRYEDLNGDGMITLEDKSISGNTIPRYTYGIDLSLSFKNFDFSMLLQGVGKASGYLYGQSIMPFVEGGTLQEQHKNRWSPENQNALFPRLTFNEINNTQNSTFWLKDASYLKLRNLQIGYTLPKSVISRINISNVRIYLSGENLASINRFWKGFDPEAPISNGAYYPHVRTLSCGLNINF